MALAVTIAPQTLPARWYWDPAIYERERDAIFGTSWQVVGFSPDLAAPGTYITATVGDRPVVVVRDAVTGLPREYAEAVLENSIAMIATVVTADELIAAWS